MLAAAGSIAADGRNDVHRFFFALDCESSHQLLWSPSPRRAPESAGVPELLAAVSILQVSWWETRQLGSSWRLCGGGRSVAGCVSESCRWRDTNRAAVALGASALVIECAELRLVVERQRNAIRCGGGPPTGDVVACPCGNHVSCGNVTLRMSTRGCKRVPFC